MAKAKQLPSGSWRCRVYDKESGKYYSFTSTLEGKAGKAEAELMANEFLLGKRDAVKNKATVGQCVEEYIRLKSNVLSPTTIAGYKSYLKNCFGIIEKVPVSKLTTGIVQSWVNQISLTMRPKSVRNAHGLLMAALNVIVPDKTFRATLPKVQKNIKHIPEAADVIRAVVGTNVELPCLMAIWLGMRMSEIRGARKSDIHGDVLTICNTVVTVDNKDVEKSQTKTTESTRQIAVPRYIMALIDKLPDNQDKLVPMSRRAVYYHFKKALSSAGVDDMSFHDLRHLNASVMLMLGVPDKYAMERGGWSSPTVIKSVYQHTFSSERLIVDNKVDSYFSSLLSS